MGLVAVDAAINQMKGRLQPGSKVHVIQVRSTFMQILGEYRQAANCMSGGLGFLPSGVTAFGCTRVHVTTTQHLAFRRVLWRRAMATGKLKNTPCALADIS